MLSIRASPFGLGRRGQSSSLSRQQRRSDTTAAAPNNRSSSPPPEARYPSALPCSYLYDYYPEEVGPTANVILTDASALPQWLLVARPVTAAEAEAKGGCLSVLSPTSPSAPPLYLCLTDSDDVVYGRAAYMAHPEETAGKQAATLTETTDGCTEGSGGGSMDTSPVESPLLLCTPNERL